MREKIFECERNDVENKGRKVRGNKRSRGKKKGCSWGRWEKEEKGKKIQGGERKERKRKEKKKKKKKREKKRKRRERGKRNEAARKRKVQQKKRDSMGSRKRDRISVMVSVRTDGESQYGIVSVRLLEQEEGKDVFGIGRWISGIVTV